MTVTINLFGARGGQGTSTTAAALGLLAARRGHHVELITNPPDTMCALLGLPAAAADANTVDVVPGFTLRSEPSGNAGLVITDTGTLADAHDAAELVQLTVLRGPCYLSLRATLDLTRRGVDGIVIVREPGRSLTRQDVATVTGLKVVAETQASPAVARAIDAGVLPASIGRLAEFVALDRWLDTLPLVVATSPATASAAPLNVRQSPVRFARSRSDTDLPLPLSGSSRPSNSAGPWTRSLHPDASTARRVFERRCKTARPRIQRSSTDVRSEVQFHRDRVFHVDANDGDECLHALALTNAVRMREGRQRVLGDPSCSGDAPLGSDRTCRERSPGQLRRRG